MAKLLALLFGKKKPLAMLSPVSLFLEAHPEFGQAKDVALMAPWAQGERQVVHFHGRPSLLFYLKGGKVQTVYRQDRKEGRVLVWGRTNS